MVDCPQCRQTDDDEPDAGPTARMVRGHEVPGVYDGVLFWQCTRCGMCWPRFDAGDVPRLHAAALAYLATHPDGMFPGGLAGDGYGVS